MGMFIIRKRTPAKAIHKDMAWLDRNLIDHNIQSDCVFDKNELVVDPTGVKPIEDLDSSPMVKWAERGWFAFYRDNWYLLVRGSDVDYA